MDNNRMAVWNKETDELVGYTTWDREDVRKNILTLERRDMKWMFEVTNRDGDTNARGSVHAIDCKNAEWVEWAFKRFGQIPIITTTGGDKVATAMATAAQIRYLNILNVRIEDGMTKQRASTLIDAAKNGYLGSTSGFYNDGSN